MTAACNEARRAIERAASGHEAPSRQEEPMADDQRERHPRRDQGDMPPEDGTRSDHAGSSSGPAGVAPGGEAVSRAAELTDADRGEAPAVNPLEDVEHRTPDA
jgi:hypothetical protein